jgi:putative ATP-dependent endonuclease of the OLD family
VHFISLGVENFRSIDSVVLDDFGSFNVLIGKNNSGKSTILSAVQFFFSCMARGGGSIVAVNTWIGSKLDFHNSDSSTPIKFKATFLLTARERDALVASITSESSQMKNVANALPQEMILTVDLDVVRRSNRKFAYASSISVSDPETTSVHRLLAISEASATELAERQNHQVQTQQQTSLLQDLL